MAPTLYQTIWVTTGARWFSTTTTCRPFSNVLVLGLKTPARASPGISSTKIREDISLDMQPILL